MDAVTDVVTDSMIDTTIVPLSKDCVKILSNWTISNKKCFTDAVTVIPLALMTSERIKFEEIVSLDTCISLCSTDYEKEACMLDIKITDHRKVARIVVVSEASILEIFKQFGEYCTTVFAELVDEYEGSSVYLAEVKLESPTAETSIKFTKTKNKSSTMWLFGLALVLTEPMKESQSEILDYTIKNFFPNPKDLAHQKVEMAKEMLKSISEADKLNLSDDNQLYKSIMTLVLNSSATTTNKHKNVIDKVNDKENSPNLLEDSVKKEFSNFCTYIDNKFHDVEERLINKISEAEQRINQKLDYIITIIQQNEMMQK